MVQISFILVEPGEPGNIGATARALNTMGFSDLRLVRPQADPLSGIAKAFAHGSEHLLQQAPTYATLDEALHDIDLACATTARHRNQKSHYVPVRSLPDVISQKGASIKRVAIVFGSERSGLSNQDIDSCDLITNIPQAKLQPSLNLSQAVMLYSFVLAEQQTQVQIKDQRLNTEQIPVEQYSHLKTSVKQLMNRVGINERYQNYAVKALSRLAYEDLYLIQHIRSFVQNKLDQLEQTGKPQ
ncbi:MAG: TrmH family RNA methyltransferase [Cyanobacteria bacterium J06632_3]